MRIVVDTNVFVGACLGSSACANVLKACLMGNATPLMGTTLFTEYETLLHRPEPLRKSKLTAREREEILDSLLARCEWIRIFYGWRPNLPDEGDNHLVELAIAGGAVAIVSRNTRDLQRSELQFPSLSILSPEQFQQHLS
ncbi:MAG: hypothetical protein RLZZ106_805 [Cyanobacteriota bacterium]|jgi:putative PIN family toxin of toxin-antitoxin system